MRGFTVAPNAIIETLNLKRPIYRETIKYGHFGKAWLPWAQPATALFRGNYRSSSDSCPAETRLRNKSRCASPSASAGAFRLLDALARVRAWAEGQGLVSRAPAH